MGINDLPGPGLKFRPRIFGEKLKRAARHGELNVLDKKQQEAIFVEVKKHATDIRRGKFTPLKQKRALSNIMASDETATDVDRRKTKIVLEHLGPGAAAKEKKPEEKETAVKASDHKHFLTKEQVERNLRLNAQRDGGFIRGRQSGEVQFAGGKALVTSIGVITNRSVPGAGHIVGNAKELGVKEQTTDFAIRRVNNTKPIGSPPLEAPLKGSRPIGL